MNCINKANSKAALTKTLVPFSLVFDNGQRKQCKMCPLGLTTSLQLMRDVHILGLFKLHDFNHEHQRSLACYIALFSQSFFHSFLFLFFKYFLFSCCPASQPSNPSVIFTVAVFPREGHVKEERVSKASQEFVGERIVALTGQEVLK